MCSERVSMDEAGARVLAQFQQIEEGGAIEFLLYQYTRKCIVSSYYLYFCFWDENKILLL